MLERLGVPPEIEQGIVQLLFAAAFPEGSSTPFVVATRDYSLWLAAFPNRKMTLLDLSVLIPPERGWGSTTGSRVEAEVKGKLLAAGWRAEQIVSQYRGASSGNIADFGLLDHRGGLIGIIEVKGDQAFLGDPMRLAIQMAASHGARYALLTDGKRVNCFDAKGDLVIERTTFPTPKDIGVDTPPFDVNETAHEQSPIAVKTIFDYGELFSCVDKLEENVFVIDHTIPWSMKSPASAKAAWDDFFAAMIQQNELATGSPFGVLARIAHLDFLAGLVAFSAQKKCTQTLISIGPQNLAVSSTFGDLRQYLTKRFRLASVIELPVDLLRPFSSVKATLLRLDQAMSSNRRETYFYSIPSRGELVDAAAQSWFSEFEKGILGKPTVKGFHAHQQQAAPWSVAANEPKSRQIEEQLAKYQKTIKLGELCDVFQGLKYSREEAIAGKGISVVRGRDITAGVNVLTQLGHYHYSGTPPEKTKIILGDILIQRIGSTPMSMVVSPGLIGAFASDTVIVIRPKSETADPFIISQFLNSTIGQSILASHARGAYAPTLSVGAIRTIAMPVFSGDVARGLRELADLEQTLRTKADKLRAGRLDIFSPGPDYLTQTRIQSLRQTSKAMSESLQQAETLDFQIRNFYPYPLAYGYRTLIGVTVPAAKYPEQLRVAENILAFLASLSLALISAADRDRVGIDVEKSWRGGVSPGHWREMAQKCSAVLSAYADNRLAQALSNLWRDKKKSSFQKTTDHLITAMNDFKHHRGPKTEEDFQSSIQQIDGYLRDCLADLAFLTEYPSRLIRDMTAVRGSRTVSIIALRCTGDHPGLAQEQVPYPESLIKDDLYIEIDENRWASLYPFLISRTCSQCKTREFYFIDKWSDSRAIVKSFEQGHTQELSDIGNAMISWQSPSRRS
jgi:hypothetical protein